MRAHEIKNIVKVGIFVAVMAAIMMVMVILIGNENNTFSAKSTIEAHVKNAQNLKTGAQVQFRGIKIGTVEAVDVLDLENIKILLNISEEYLQWIKSDSKVSIQNAGLVGDKFIEVLGGTPQANNYKPGKDVLYAENSLSMKAIANKGGDILQSTQNILTRFDHILAKIEQGDKFSQAVENFYRITFSMEKLMDRLEKSNIDALLTKASSTMGNLDKITRQITTGPGTLHSMVYDDGIHDDLRLLLGGAQRNQILKYFIRRTIKNADKIDRDLTSQAD